MKACRLIIQLAVGLVAIWMIACVALIVFARTLIYPFQPGFPASQPQGVPGAQARILTADDGTPLTVWLVAPEAGRPVVLFFMGNGGVLASHAPMLAHLASQGMGIAALNYRGAGGAPGKPSQTVLTTDALTLYDHLEMLLGRRIPGTERVILGTSLGAALAVQLAARRDAAALVLQSPFNRLCETANYHYPIFPVCLLLPYERWNSGLHIETVTAPLLILHGEADLVIPISHGRKLLAAAAAADPKRLIAYPDAGHNDLDQHGAPAAAAAFIDQMTRS